jgi:hypothetical protein
MVMHRDGEYGVWDFVCPAGPVYRHRGRLYLPEDDDTPGVATIRDVSGAIGVLLNPTGEVYAATLLVRYGDEIKLVQPHCYERLDRPKRMNQTYECISISPFSVARKHHFLVTKKTGGFYVFEWDANVKVKLPKKKVYGTIIEVVSGTLARPIQREGSEGEAWRLDR